MSRWKFIPFVMGVCLVVATLIGANRLANTPGTPPGAGGGNPAPVNPPKTDGLVAKGDVAAEHEPMAFYLPAHMAAGKVVQVMVKTGQSVKKGDVLVKFDTWQLEGELKKADAAVQAAIRTHQLAQAKQDQHKILVDKAKLAVNNAVQVRDKAKELVEALRKKLDLQLRQLGGTRDVEKAIREEPEFLKAEGLLESAENQIKEKNFDLNMLEKEPLAVTLEAAVFQTQMAQAEVDRIKAAIAHADLKAEIAGVIERVNVAPGQVMYPQSRTPMFWLITDGNRYVKAEINPEFAHKIRDKEGSKVIISDDSVPGLTYEGVVEQVGTAFLPKTGSVDLLNGKQTKVLEVNVRVVDPAPPGKPPLRVGQPVRVTFP